ncbi:MAG: hypothetical protein AAGL66_10270, partial [Pseudomonadota bacterium]
GFAHRAPKTRALAAATAHRCHYVTQHSGEFARTSTRNQKRSSGCGMREHPAAQEAEGHTAGITKGVQHLIVIRQPR